MKTLYIVRHAKSSWDDPMLEDFDRPLNDRGKRDAPIMGRRLKEKDIHPSLILSSSAKRAFSTSKKIAKVIGYSKDKIKTTVDLFHASEEEILQAIQTLKDKHDSVMIIGHNPGLTEFVNTIMEEVIEIENVPTCGIVA